MSTIVIGGSTASGKSALALRLAKQTGGLIVNADSIQLYRDLPILTARPTAQETCQADHRLYGILGAFESCSAAAWLDIVEPIVDECIHRRRKLIIVGGTGFYLKSLLFGLPSMPVIDVGVRRSIRDSEAPSPELHAELARIDPAMGDRLNPADRQRIMRALEVMLSTSRSLLEWQLDPPVRLQLPEPVNKLALLPAREPTRFRIGERLAAMLREGLGDEVSLFLKAIGGRASPLLKADGVGEFKAHIEGEITLVEAQERTFNKVCRYAKRQRTYFRSQLSEFERFEGFADDVPTEVFNALSGL